MSHMSKRVLRATINSILILFSFFSNIHFVSSTGKGDPFVRVLAFLIGITSGTAQRQIMEYRQQPGTSPANDRNDSQAQHTTAQPRPSVIRDAVFVASQASQPYSMPTNYIPPSTPYSYAPPDSAMNFAYQQQTSVMQQMHRQAGVVPQPSSVQSTRLSSIPRSAAPPPPLQAHAQDPSPDKLPEVVSMERIHHEEMRRLAGVGVQNARENQERWNRRQGEFERAWQGQVAAGGAMVASQDQQQTREPATANTAPPQTPVSSTSAYQHRGLQHQQSAQQQPPQSATTGPLPSGYNTSHFMSVPPTAPPDPQLVYHYTKDDSQLSLRRPHPLLEPRQPIFDPMQQTFDRPLHGTRSLITHSGGEWHADQPNVTSPLTMVMLPFGGVIELARHYPETLKDDDEEADRIRESR